VARHPPGVHDAQPADAGGAGRCGRDAGPRAPRRRARARRRHPGGPRGRVPRGQGRVMTQATRGSGTTGQRVGLHLVRSVDPAPAPVPASAAWREGDPVGRRQFLDIGTVRLERGGFVPDVRMAYETWGTLSPTKDNAVLVLHALTGDSHVLGPIEEGHL